MFAERIVHLDMDAFFVEVERRRSPRLVGRAILVGGTGARSVVSSASYEARQRGVHSGMPMVQARRLCPHAEVVPADHQAYRQASDEVFAALESVTPHLEAVSIDEAFLDIVGLRLLYGSPTEVGRAVQAAVIDATRLPCSVGIGTSKLIAKMASRKAKPAGLLLVPAGGEEAFLHPQPVRELWGVGEATHARLEELGVVTIGDLAALPGETLIRRLGPALGTLLGDLAAGIDERPVAPAGAPRSISVEETYERDLTDAVGIERHLLELAERLAERLRRGGVAATTVHLKVRFGDFATTTRSHTADLPLASAPRLFAVAKTLLGRTPAATRPVRLLGLGVDGIVDAAGPRQLDLAGDPRQGVEVAIDAVRDRFGTAAIERARLLAPGPEDASPAR